MDAAAVTTLPVRDGGAAIPALGLGVYQVPEADVTDVVLTALGLGYRLVDTAQLYRNERGVGAAIAQSGIPREDIMVTTKIWNDRHGYDETLRAFDESAARLGLDAVDLLLIHWPVPTRDRYVETWRAVLRLRDEGRVRIPGVSNFQPAHLARLGQETGEVPMVNQVELNPYFAQPEVREAHARLGVVTQAWAPLARAGELFTDPVVTRIAGKHRRTPAQVVLRWHGQHGVAAIPKSVTPSRLAENLDLGGFALDSADMSGLDGLDRGVRTGPDPDSFQG